MHRTKMIRPAGADLWNAARAALTCAAFAGALAITAPASFAADAPTPQSWTALKSRSSIEQAPVRISAVERIVAPTDVTEVRRSMPQGVRLASLGDNQVAPDKGAAGKARARNRSGGYRVVLLAASGAGVGGPVQSECHDGRAQDAAVRNARAHQASGQWSLGRRAYQRSGTLRRRPHHRPVQSSGGSDRHDRAGRCARQHDGDRPLTRQRRAPQGPGTGRAVRSVSRPA